MKEFSLLGYRCYILVDEMGNDFMVKKNMNKKVKKLELDIL